ncbi:hypothetical protein GCM10028868_17090 [Virgibacillus kimchii]
MQAIIKDFVKVFDLYKAHLVVFYQENKYLKPEYEEKIKKKRDQFRKMIVHVISEGKKSGEFRQGLSVDITAMAVLGMVNWIYKWYQPDGEKTIEEIGNIYIDLILHAVIKPETIISTEYEELLIEKLYSTK